MAIAQGASRASSGSPTPRRGRDRPRTGPGTPPWSAAPEGDPHPMAQQWRTDAKAPQQTRGAPIPSPDRRGLAAPPVQCPTASRRPLARD